MFFAGTMGMKALVKSLNRGRDGHHMEMSRKCYLCDLVHDHVDCNLTEEVEDMGTSDQHSTTGCYLHVLYCLVLNVQVQERWS